MDQRYVSLLLSNMTLMDIQVKFFSLPVEECKREAFEKDIIVLSGIKRI